MELYFKLKCLKSFNPAQGTEFLSTLQVIAEDLDKKTSDIKSRIDVPDE